MKQKCMKQFSERNLLFDCIVLYKHFNYQNVENIYIGVRVYVCLYDWESVVSLIYYISYGGLYFVENQVVVRFDTITL